MCVSGEASLQHNAITYSLQAGETILLPASIAGFKLNGNAKLLEVSL